jgi:chromosome segregation ATPase
MSHRMPLLMDRVVSEMKNVDHAEAAVTDANVQIGFNREQIASLSAELKRLREEVAAVTQNQQALEQQVADARQEIDRLTADNAEKARQLARQQQQRLQRALEQNARNATASVGR